MIWTTLQTRLAEVVDLGGPVVALLLAISVLSLAVITFKLWQFTTSGVGRHAAIRRALANVDNGQTNKALADLSKSRNAIAPLLTAALAETAGRSRIEAEASGILDRLSSGFRVLDTIAQTSPLLGLFGTVLGMIDAFRALQAAGTVVDPSILAGGIWVALMTTAAGLAVAMPASIVLTYLESRVEKDRVMTNLAFETVFDRKA